MDLSGWRDLVIIIWGVVATIALVFISVIIYLFYKRTMSLLESADMVVGKVADIVDYADKEVIRPVTQLGTMIQGILQGISLFSSIFKKKERQDE
ncbi:MAG: hypothetical protein ABSG90_05170 [Dehalococcoidia bacterium]|jgi:hypothetical protein